jgi:UDP-GlcNAc:undecaprenyl-phosphate GlcNAc-1-phosphate transferase
VPPFLSPGGRTRSPPPVGLFQLATTPPLRYSWRALPGSSCPSRRTILHPAVKFAVSFAAGLLCVFVARTVARRWKIHNEPNPIVETHVEPVPYLGGVGVFIPFLVLLFVFFGAPWWVVLLALVAGALTFLGTYDDVRPVRVMVKFAIEVALIAAFYPLFVHTLDLHPDVVLIILGVIGIVVLGNGFNQVDVMDGLASGVSLFICLALFVMYQSPSSSGTMGAIAVAPLILAGLLGAFLVFNRPSATIYLGDGGSLPLGFVISIFLAVWIFDTYPWSVQEIVVAVSVISPVIFEVLLVSFHRAKRGWSVFQGSPDHFALRLVRAGWSVPRVLVTTLSVCAVLAASVGLLWLPALYSWAFAGVLVVFYGVAFWRLSKIEVPAITK